jgi:uncharacterized protein
MRKYALPGILSLCACVAAACNPLAAQPDRTQYFLLAPVGSAAAVSTSSTAQLSLGVGPIKFPEYLKRPGLVTRTSSDRLTVSDEKRWAEPLDQNFESTLCQNLSRILGTQRITTYPWYADTHIDYQVELWVMHFEADENGQAQLSAVWTIKDGDGHVLASGQSTASAPVQSNDTAGSAALSQDLSQMSSQIADRIVQLNASSRPRALAGD